jgi:hypothetical protein
MSTPQCARRRHNVPSRAALKARLISASTVKLTSVLQAKLLSLLYCLLAAGKGEAVSGSAPGGSRFSDPYWNQNGGRASSGRVADQPLAAPRGPGRKQLVTLIKWEKFGRSQRS